MGRLQTLRYVVAGLLVGLADWIAGPDEAETGEGEILPVCVPSTRAREMLADAWPKPSPPPPPPAPPLEGSLADRIAKARAR